MADDPTVARELGIISAKLDNIEKTLEAHDRSRSNMYEKIDGVKSDVRDVKSDVAGVKSDIKVVKASVENMKPHVEDWKTLRNRGWGLLAGVCIAGGAIGAKFSHVTDWVIKLFSKGG